jgi:hypothetical protein
MMEIQKKFDSNWRGATPAELIVFVVVLVSSCICVEKCNPNLRSRLACLPAILVQSIFCTLSAGSGLTKLEKKI